MFRALLFSLFALALNCKSVDNLTKKKQLITLIIEIDDQEQLRSYSELMTEYRIDSTTVFKRGFYSLKSEDGSRIFERGSSWKNTEQIEWHLLIDNLAMSNYIFGFDWKGDLPTIKWALGLMANQKGYVLPGFPVLSQDNPGDTYSILTEYNVVLKQSGYTIICLYNDSDEYNTALVKTENVDQIIDKASQINQKIFVFK